MRLNGQKQCRVLSYQGYTAALAPHACLPSLLLPGVVSTDSKPWDSALGGVSRLPQPHCTAPWCCWVVTGRGGSYCPGLEGLWRGGALSPGPIPSRPFQCLEKAQNISMAHTEALVGCTRGLNPSLAWQMELFTTPGASLPLLPEQCWQVEWMLFLWG